MAKNNCETCVDGIDLQPLWTIKINFDHRQLHIANSDLATFKPTRAAFAFGSAFVLVGIAIAVLMLALAPKAPWFNPFGAVFVAIGLIFLYLANRKISFDHFSGTYRKGWNKPLLILMIQSLQLLPEMVSSKKHHYICYQLNLVLPDGARQNIVTYTNKKKAAQDAKKLAHFLGIELWNGVESDDYVP